MTIFERGGLLSFDTPNMAESDPDDSFDLCVGCGKRNRTNICTYIGANRHAEGAAICPDCLTDLFEAVAAVPRKTL